MSLSSLILIMIALATAIVFVYRDIRKERDTYYGVVEEHYGLNAVLHRLKELRRCGKKLWDEAPQHWNRSDNQENLRTIQKWEAKYREWLDETTHAVRDLCSPTDVTRFQAVDESREVDTSVNSYLEMRKVLGVFEQYLGNLGAIIEVWVSSPTKTVEG